MREDFFKKFNIPVSCEVNNTIFKKLFYENSTMNKVDKEIFQKNIDKIIWLYSFKEDTINIRPYKDEVRDYEEVAIIKVLLLNDTKIKRISEIIQKTIPYPLILLFHYEDKVLFNAAHKRNNKADENKNTVEEFIYTDWISLLKLSDREEKFIESMNIKGFSFSNFYKFYCDALDRINIFNASKYQSDFEALNIKGVVKVKAIVDEIEKLDVEILKLKSKIKHEVQFNKKVEMNIEIKKNASRRKQLIQVLNN
ncbi:DUF4391 domain-containing protein [Clostridium psychrophilum]|uniref:DUF4391 domain-containing protein n=1 Tax=Clostridium psychrophilum TaxID=132926 RepID=UPI001C0B5E88|nr:DUF4391 domain-containing protein [Clostridium psychrophilum]MBU3181184.1 DUF4391 domain-containing protein [Clostridium psychrophilum]